jgi:hypothetical protein
MGPVGRLGFLLSLVLLALAPLCAGASAGTRFAGDWDDMLWEKERIGPLKITDTAMTFGKGGVYRTTFAERFDYAGMLLDVFRVEAGSLADDPHGCGRSGRVTYVLVGDNGIDERTHGQSILVTFYGGASMPDPATLSGDKNVCTEHAFGRNRGETGRTP